MSYIYYMTESNILLEDGESFLTYGISIRGNDSLKSEFSDFVDVSVNFNHAKKILDILNTYEVEPCHFHDVIIDELNR